MNSSFLVILKGIIAAFLNRRLEDDKLDIKDELRSVLKEVRLPTNLMGTGSDGDIGSGLRDTLSWVLDYKEDQELTPEDVLARVQINLHTDTHYADVIRTAISNENETKERTRIRVSTNMSEIRSELGKQRLQTKIREANKTLNSSDSYLDKEEFLGNLIESLNEFKSELKEGGPVSQSSLNSDDPESIRTIFKQAQESVSADGVLKTGLVGLNKMCGVGGIVRGLYVNIGALTHNYKTGLLLDLFRQIPMHNKPFMLDPSKKPLVLRVSFENRIEQDLPKLYKDIKEQETGEKVDIKSINVDDAVEYISSKLKRNGYHFAMEFFSPNDFTVDDLITVLEEYESKGYEIHLLNLDYLELIAKAKGNARPDQVITDSAEKLRGYCFPRRITVITAHQLSTEAQALSREGTSNFAKRVSTGGWYMNCKSLHTKLDLEIICHIHKTEEESYLTFARGKHRGGEETPMSHRYFAYKFHRIGTIHDDIDKEVPEVIYNVSEGMQSVEGAKQESNNQSQMGNSNANSDDADW